MYLLAVLRKIVSILTGRYRPELHYMRGPDPHECSNVVKLLGINVYRKTRSAGYSVYSPILL